MNYLPRNFARCPSNPNRQQCKDCKRNITNSPIDPEMAWQTWIGPWTGHGECPDFVGVKDEA